MKHWLIILHFFLAGALQAHETEPLVQLYEELVPSVVTIHTFENKVEDGKTKFADKPNGLGSGVIISEQGLIATAAHVVHSADGLHVEFNNGEKRLAKVLSTVIWADLALIQVEDLPKGVKVAKLANSDNVRIGEKIFVIGAPLGLSKTLTVGYLSGVHPEVHGPIPESAELIQTDAAINPGNSGGPMFNMKGNVIGIASHIQSLSGGSDGLGFAVTSNAVKSWLLEKRPFWSGIVFYPVTRTIRQALGLPFSGGVIVEKVNQESKAYAAGLRGGTIKSQIEDHLLMLGGDIIIAIDGVAINNVKSSSEIMNRIRDGENTDSIELDIWRQGKVVRIKVTLSPLQDK